ncbi:purine catabolism regulator [Geomicrobium halophilum]|uniref:Purine catabolism regulator n=1 Tax=Geomicrobium halophilum TaxID=549000 RepID=A0A841PS99_9BACL|nr:PucR family transcriptional regulator [Geomicrobium halophilum]MBB6450056.1 purine catabolism regulator [Geomicrobium halophilum]
MLTIDEIVQRPMFQNAQVVNKKANLQRTVRWVHVLEIIDFDTLIHGNEMILSTGVAISDQGLEYVKKLIDHGAACLCIELSSHFPSVSKDIVDLADTYHFPIIVFTSIVRFVDITQDLHAEIINHQHQQLSELDQLSNEFHQFTLHTHGNLKILKKLRESTRKELIFLPNEGAPHFLPALEKQEQQRIQSMVEQMIKKNQTGSWYDEKRQKSFLIKRIEAMGQNWGMILMRNCTPLTTFESLALERATNALAQNLLRFFYTEEKRLLNEQSWIHDLIEKNIKTEREAVAKLPMSIKESEELLFRICVIKMKEPYDSTSDIQGMQYHTIRYIRHFFQQHMIDPLITTGKNHTFIVLAVDKATDNLEKKRMMKTVDAIEKNPLHMPLRVFVSQPYVKLQQAPSAIQEAEDVMKIVNIQSDPPIHFYEDTGIYQLLIKLDDYTLENFVQTYLSPILEYDRKKNSDLLYTLNVYLQLNCSKQQTAKKLHIARQTLYHRLNTIENLLGQKLTHSPLLRLATEVAIGAFKLNENLGSATP